MIGATNKIERIFALKLHAMKIKYTMVGLLKTETINGYNGYDGIIVPIIPKWSKTWKLISDYNK